MRRAVQIETLSAAFMALAFSLGAKPGNQQTLYYLCAIPGPAELYRFDAEEGTGVLVRKLADSVEIVVADYERRKLVVASPVLLPHTISVIDMAAPVKEHAVSMAYDDGLDKPHPGNVYLLEIPRQGLFVAMPFQTLTGTPSVAALNTASDLTALSLEAENAKSGSLPFSSLAGIRMSGSVGGALYSRLPEVRGNPLRLLIADPVGYDIGFPRPPYLAPSENPLSDGYHLAAVNDSVVLLMPFLPRPAAADVVDIYDRTTFAWRREKLPFTVSAVRAFGPWVTAISTENGTGSATHTSPGQEKRATEYFYGKATIDGIFVDSRNYYPGDLLVLNARTRQRFIIHTGQGDSEVILITDAAVYYRVNDAIFRADVVAGKLSEGTKVVEGPEVPQAHWAFLGPAAN